METLPPTKVLIAEDTPDILELLADKLAFEGFAVIKAVDGEDAWEKVGRESPDVILLDLMMPKMDGFTFLRKLRETPPTKKWQPVIILSALNDLESMKKCFSLEAEHYIVKPFHPNDVVQGVRKMLQLIPHRQGPSGLSRK